MSLETSATTVMQRCDILGTYSEESGCLTRRFASPSMRQVNETVGQWMRDAGMSVEQDAVGNLIGRYEAASPDAKTLLLGSHLDTVRDAGKYDGPLGVMVAIACIARLHEQSQHLPFAIEVPGFADEEGLRYHTAYLGSKAMTGMLDGDTLQLTDADGISIEQAIRTFGASLTPGTVPTARWQKDELLGYCEVHIEQGPVLEAENLPVGVVSAIACQKRFTVSLTGEAGHAGTVPMRLRRDALNAAAEFILTVEKLAHNIPGLVATVGQLNLYPGASNVIPGQITLSLDVRHQQNQTCEKACQLLEEQARDIGQARHIDVNWQRIQEHPAVPCSPRIMQLLSRAIEESGYPVRSLVSGAGHDAVTLSHLTDIGMLFVRCRGGVSHNPAEAVTTEDVAVAIGVTERFLALMAQEVSDSANS